MEQAQAAENSSGFNPSPVCKMLVSVCAAILCCEPQRDASTEISALILIKKQQLHDRMNPEEENKGKEAMHSTQTHTETHTVREDTHHPHVSALSSCIPACGGRPRACDCVRGEFWLANSIWTEGPIQRCQYSPHCPSSLIMQGGREGGKCRTKCQHWKCYKQTASRSDKKKWCDKHGKKTKYLFNIIECTVTLEVAKRQGTEKLPIDENDGFQWPEMSTCP